MTNFKRSVKKLINKASGPLGVREMQREVIRLKQSVMGVARENQISLMLEYRRQMAAKETLPPLNDVEFRTFSQNGEDGILWYIFSLLGTHNKTCVEICAGNGQECNTANLIVNHGWTGLLFDGNEENVASGSAYYRGHPDTFTFPPKFIHAWIDKDNINQLILDQGFKGEIDLLSLDIDGIDYWLWEAITVVRPRVVVAEIQAIWGDTRSVTVPYRSDFRAEYVDGFGVYSGASLPAFVKLARRKGYRLIGTQRYGFNAFFVRNDVAQEMFPEVSASDCLKHPFATWAQEKLLPLVSRKEWVEV
jgi:hypothetical protein